MYFGSDRKGDEFVKRLRGMSPLDVRSVAGRYITAMPFPCLGDTTGMRGH